MLTLMLILGIASIFSSGALANSYGSTGDRESFYISIVAFTSGVFIFISMIGVL